MSVKKDSLSSWRYGVSKYVCMCVCARMCVCACVCMCVACVRYEMCFSASVRALGSHEMGHHKLPIIIIILIDQQNQMCK